MLESNEQFFGYFPDAELVFGLVCPLGADYAPVVATLENYLAQFGYKTNKIRISELFEDLLISLGEEWAPPSDKALQFKYKMDAGNKIRALTSTNDFLARVAASMIASDRVASGGARETGKGGKQPLLRTAHIVSTLRRPEEVKLLRRIYGNGFYLIGLSAPRSHRDNFFKEMAIDPKAAAELIRTDADELTEYGHNDHGQKTSDTFHLADVFFSTENYKSAAPRFLDLVFGCPTETPTAEEHAMFMAYSASLRSGDLSRQVGAAIIEKRGDLLSVGCNEVPKSGGGLYGPEKNADRDIERRQDSNEKEKNAIIERVLEKLGRNDLTVEAARKLLKPTGITDLTEFGRTVHAEMEALLACARTGVSVRGATLYTTTFPCHNCCRHIIAAGIERVVYIEPYAKSKAPELHGDAVSIDQEEPGKVPFLPFIGVGPRRYFDLFSLNLSTGNPVERKKNGELIQWTRSGASARLQMQPTTYLDRENLASASVRNLLSRK